MRRFRLLSVLLVAAAAAGACARPAPAPAASTTTTTTTVTSPTPSDSAPSPGARPAPPFVGTRWVLVRVGDQRIMTATGDPRRVPHLVFDAEHGVVRGSGGCNHLTGSYTARGESLTFGPVAGTRMACPDVMATEAAFTASLASVRGWRLVDGRLELLDAAGGAGQVVAAFTPAPAEP